ncbi:MAG: hypothetical protein WCA63_10185, partial [Gallionella sp.]
TLEEDKKRQEKELEQLEELAKEKSQSKTATTLHHFQQKDFKAQPNPTHRQDFVRLLDDAVLNVRK